MTSSTKAFQSADAGGLDLAAISAALSGQFVVVTGATQLVWHRRVDTFDRRLRAAGLTLDHQSMGRGERLVLGRLDGSSTVTVPFSGQRWPAPATALPSGPVGDAVVLVAGIRSLMLFSEERRRVRPLELKNHDGKTVVRVELDEPASKTAGPAQLTVRAMRGYDAPARRSGRLLAGIGLRAVVPDAPDVPDAEPPAALTDRHTPARLLLTSALSAYVATMRDNLPGLLDDVDTEFLHDFRVAVRRTRSTLKLGRPALPVAFRTLWEPAFKGLGDVTTPVRDLDVYELDLPMMARWLVAADPTDLEPLATHLRRRRTAERRAPVRLLRSAAFQRLLSNWEETLAQLSDLPEDAGGAPLAAGPWADVCISRAYQRVARGGAAISGDSPAVDLHTLRKRCKELRYALEVCAPVVAKGPRKHVVADLKVLQDVLGRFQDTEVQRQALRGFAEEMMADGTGAQAVLAMGELIGHLDAEQDRARHEFEGAFAHFARPSSQEMMHRLGGRQ